MRKLQASFKEGVEAGNTGRPMSVTLVLDDEAQVDALICAAAAVKIQAKTRKKVTGWLFEDINGKEVTVSSIMSRAAAQMTSSGAVKVFTSVDVPTKIEMLFDMGQDETMIRAFFDAQLKNEKCTAEEHQEAMELLDMANE